MEKKPLMVTRKRSGFGYKIEGRRGRYEGWDIWETSECPNCPFKREAISISENVVGVCTKSKAYKVIVKRHVDRKPRHCNKLKSLFFGWRKWIK